MKKTLDKILIGISITALLVACDQNHASLDKKAQSSLPKEKTEPSAVKESASHTKQDKLIKEALAKQLSNGISALYDNSFDIVGHKFSRTDLDASIPILNNALSDYRKPNNEQFLKKIKEIFGRTIDFNSNSKYLYINFNDPKDREFKYHRNDNSIEIRPYSVFVVKRHNFISQLYGIPEILDYQKHYPQIAQTENKMQIDRKDDDGSSLTIYRWLDDESIDREKNIKTLIARNKYLFNNDKSQLPWLLDNDEEFMVALIKIYNYSKDTEHRQWYKDKH